MPNSPELNNRIIEAIRNKVAVLNCPVCHQGPFTLADGYVQLMTKQEFGGSGIWLGGPMLPSVALICQTCGNTVLLNLIALGLQDLLQESKAEEAS